MQRTFGSILLCFFLISSAAGSAPGKNQTGVSSEIDNLIKGAEDGNDNFQFYLADAYRAGRLIPRNSEEALKWYRRAAEQGNLNAQRELSRVFQTGMLPGTLLKIEKNEKEALFWCRKAAEQGDVDSQCNLGAMIARGTPVDAIEAYKWLDLCMASPADRPSITAPMIRDSLAKKMTAEQIGEARRLADEWASGYIHNMGSGPYNTGWGVVKPKILTQTPFGYTAEARKAKIGGTVLVEFIVRKDGVTEGFKVLKGLGYGLDELVIDRISQKWSFSPGTFQGKPVDVKVHVETVFKLY